MLVVKITPGPQHRGTLVSQVLWVPSGPLTEGSSGKSTVLGPDDMSRALGTGELLCGLVSHMFKAPSRSPNTGGTLVSQVFWAETRSLNTGELF